MRADASGPAALFCLAFDDGFEVCALPFCFFFSFCFLLGVGRFLCLMGDERALRTFSYEYVIWGFDGAAARKGVKDSSFRRQIIYDICDWIRFSLPNPTFFFFLPPVSCASVCSRLHFCRELAPRGGVVKGHSAAHTRTHQARRCAYRRIKYLILYLSPQNPSFLPTIPDPFFFGLAIRVANALRRMRPQRFNL